MKRTIMSLLVGLLLASGARPCLAQQPAGSEGGEAERVTAAGEARLLGRRSCATATCHGGAIGRGPAWNHAMSQFLAHDPHAGAGLLLRDDDSRRIVETLEPRSAESASAYDRVLRQRCISCHATVTPAEVQRDAPLSSEILARGVSCESCHGAASGWLEAHVRSDWQGPERFEAASGMRDTESLVGRAETCLRCHVGSRRTDSLVRDVNHDLIAAGHPPLRFDFALYHENLPAHWNLSSDVEEKFAQSHLRLRSVGRAAGLAAAARLSSQRAADHLEDANVPWPELADYDCFDCHQTLSMQQYRLPAASVRRSPLRISDGLPLWNAWHTVDQLQLGRDQLQRLSPHRSDPSEMAVAGEALAERYEAEAQRSAGQMPEPADALRRILETSEQQPSLDWHQAAVRYLRVEAALRDLVERDPQASRWLEQLRARVEPLLRFDRRGIESEDELEEAHLESPARFDPGEFQTALLGIFSSDSISNDLPPSAGEQP